MMRIQTACLSQTIQFETQEDLDRYLDGLQKKQVQHRIDAEEKKEDGSVMLSIRRQYNTYDCGNYLG